MRGKWFLFKAAERAAGSGVPAPAEMMIIVQKYGY
jgi:hypothetical protein